MIQQFKSKYLSIHVFLNENGIKHTLISQIDEGNHITSVIRLDSGVIRSTLNQLSRIPNITLFLYKNKIRLTIIDKKPYNDQNLDRLTNYMRGSYLND